MLLDSTEASRERELMLAPGCSLKRLETPVVYRRSTDELYELDEEALNLLNRPTISSADWSGHDDFIQACLTEQLLVERNGRQGRVFAVDPSTTPPLPSLRYLLLHLTEECNLRCRHCYNTSGRPNHLPLSVIEKLFDDLTAMHGLIVLLSGGEPLCHPEFWALNSRLPSYDLRFELLSNGTLITPDIAQRLKVQLVQVSLDGMQASHDFMRGEGTFQKTLNGIEALQGAGIRVAVSSMIFDRNIHEFEQMTRLLDDYRITDWIINQPSRTGRWANYDGTDVSLKVAVNIMATFARGEGPHRSVNNFTCGSHICTVTADGLVYPCPLLNDREMRMGDVVHGGIREAWATKKGISVDMLDDCRTCESFEQCRGGCRFRAKEHGNICGRDPVLCEAFRHA